MSEFVLTKAKLKEGVRFEDIGYQNWKSSWHEHHQYEFATSAKFCVRNKKKKKTETIFLCRMNVPQNL